MIKSGDILLFKVTPNSPWHDKLIAFGEKVLRKQFSKNLYYHVAIVDSDIDLMLEAIWPKTHITKINLASNVEIYRVKKINKKQVKLVLNWAHKNLNAWYNVGRLFFGIFPSTHKVICSTYVAKAFKAGGVVLGAIDEKIFSPDEIAVSPLLKRIK